MDAKRIAAIFEECATLLELKGENAFRANAYRNAARAVTQIEDLPGRVEKGDLASERGIGKTIAEKIAEMIETGELEFHARLREEVPAGLVDMLRISGFGPKRIKQAHDELGIDSIEALRAAAEDGRLAAIKGMGAKSAERVLEGIAFLEKAGKRVLLPVAMALAEPLREELAAAPGVERIELCGSLRRGRETIKDIDLLVASNDPDAVMDRFVGHDAVEAVVGRGPTKSSVRLEGGIAADLRVVSPEQFPFALHYFTGSKEHNVRMRQLAQDRGLKLNEYELAGKAGSVACADEGELFEALGLSYIPPEMREDTGEIDAARDRTLPELLEPEDLTGVFHCHTDASDGRATLDQMAEAARSLGLSFLGIADHSQTAAYAGGLKPDRVRVQHKAIDRLNERLAPFRVFKGIESDILPDGGLDYDDATLESFDYVVASVHQPMNMDRRQMTERVLRAIRHPACTILGHPTGRLLLQRDAYPIDIEEVLREAAEHEVLIEINANPRRLDLEWLTIKRAVALGVTLVINPDAHSTGGLTDTRWGVVTARRGWLRSQDVFNTRPLEEVARWLADRKERRRA